MQNNNIPCAHGKTSSTYECPLILTLDAALLRTISLVYLAPAPMAERSDT